MANDIGKILPKYLTDCRHKRGAILASILGGITSSIIGLAYEGISSFLNHKRHKALHKAVAVMDKKTNLHHNKIHHLEVTMIMYGVYNSDTLKDLIDTVHRMQNFTTWNEKTFAGKLHDWMELYSHNEGVHYYAINSKLFLTTVREKHLKMYERFIEELKMYSKAIQVLSKGYLPISLLPPSKLEKMLKEMRIATAKSNKDYDLVLKRLYLYYDMKLVMFGIDNHSSEAKTDLEMYFTINLTFVNYFDDTIEELGIPILRNWTTQEQILLLSTETFEISPNLLNAPKTL